MGESVGERVYLNTAFESANWCSLWEGCLAMPITFCNVHSLRPSNSVLESFQNRACPRTFITAFLATGKDKKQSKCLLKGGVIMINSGISILEIRNSEISTYNDFINIS